MEEPLTVSELMGDDGDEAGERLQAFGRGAERSVRSPTPGGQLRPLRPRRQKALSTLRVGFEMTARGESRLGGCFIVQRTTNDPAFSALR
jgi:hypothetical protein